MNLLKSGIFGDLQARLYSVEFQKGRLPHNHILLWLSPNCKIRPYDIDQLVLAEIPCPDSEPELHDLVKQYDSWPVRTLPPQQSLHARRAKIWRCSKMFPEEFIQATEQGQDGYPKYRGRTPEDGGHTLAIRKNINGQEIHQVIDNE